MRPYGGAGCPSQSVPDPPDLIEWTATGPEFTAESETIVSEFDVDETGRYFRIRQVPRSDNGRSQRRRGRQAFTPPAVEAGGAGWIALKNQRLDRV